MSNAIARPMSNAIARPANAIARPLPKVGGFALQRPQLFPMIAFIALLLGISLFFVWSRLQVVNLEYSISSLESKVRSLQQEGRRLRLEAASLRSPERLDGVARTELGLGLPTPAQVITVE